MMTDALENEFLDGITGVAQLITPAIVYVALFTGDPSDTGSVTTELSGSGYARKSLAGTFSSATGTSGTVSNTAEIAFDTATGDWSAVGYVGLMKSDVETTDDMIVHLALDQSVTILNGQAFTFDIGTLTLTAA